MFLYKKVPITTFESVRNLGKLDQEIPKILKIQAKIGKIILAKSKVVYYLASTWFQWCQCVEVSGVGQT